MEGKLFFAVFVVLISMKNVNAGPPDWVPAELLEMVAGDKSRCMEEHGTTQALIDQVNDGNLVNDRALSCYMFCLLDAFSLVNSIFDLIVDEEGNLEAEMLLGFLPENLVAKGTDILNACAKQDGADGCDRVFNVAKCVQAKVPELWFMV
ncbi:general odorant-binding protein 83a-like [Vespula squamosa]|uniref:General odorant-binding protein 83a-like n=1 Tax=Vespula squamosa TaxID=30214 RepID=A0ABD1ZV26_VESSQ